MTPAKANRDEPHPHPIGRARERPACRRARHPGGRESRRRRHAPRSAGRASGPRPARQRRAARRSSLAGVALAASGALSVRRHRSSAAVLAACGVAAPPRQPPLRLDGAHPAPACTPDRADPAREARLVNLTESLCFGFGLPARRRRRRRPGPERPRPRPLRTFGDARRHDAAPSTCSTACSSRRCSPTSSPT